MLSQNVAKIGFNIQRHFHLQKRTLDRTVELKNWWNESSNIGSKYIDQLHIIVVLIAAMVYKSFKGDSIGGKVLRGPSKIDKDSKKSQTRSRKGMYVIDPMTALYMLLYVCLCVP